MEPFRSFLAVDMIPVDADPDIYWIRSGMYFHPLRISTCQEDDLVVPNLVVLLNDLPVMSIQEYIWSLQWPSLPLSEPGEDAGFGSCCGHIPYECGVQEPNVNRIVNYSEAGAATPGGFTQPETEEDRGTATRTHISHPPTGNPAPAFHQNPPPAIASMGLPEPFQLRKSWIVPPQSISLPKPQNGRKKSNSSRPGPSSSEYKHLVPTVPIPLPIDKPAPSELAPSKPAPRKHASRKPAPMKPAPKKRSAGVRKHVQAFSPLDHETPPSNATEPPVKKRQKLFAGVKQQGRPSAGTSPFTAPPPQIFKPSGRVFSRRPPPTPHRTQSGPPPPSVSSRPPTTQPLPHVPNLSQIVATDSPACLVHDEEGIRAVIPDVSIRRQNIRDFNISAAKLSFARLAASQREENRKKAAIAGQELGLAPVGAACPDVDFMSTDLMIKLTKSYPTLDPALKELTDLCLLRIQDQLAGTPPGSRNRLGFRQFIDQEVELIDKTRFKASTYDSNVERLDSLDQDLASTKASSVAHVLKLITQNLTNPRGPPLSWRKDLLSEIINRFINLSIVMTFQNSLKE